MQSDTVRVLIWGKTYPELSAKYVETVCTGGVREDGSPIRLYPVPLRYLDTGNQYQLYDWVEAPIQRNLKDPRPESFKVSADRIALVGHINPDTAGWRERANLIFRDPSWQFANIGQLKEAQRRDRQSIGIVTPGEIVDVRAVAKTAKERTEWDEKMLQVQSQGDLFRPEYKELEFPSHDIRLRWRCREPCDECSRHPHDMKALDWGLLKLARREGFEKARARLEVISDLRTHDFRLFMGNFFLHQHIFGIIGMWYPKIPAQPSLL